MSTARVGAFMEFELFYDYLCPFVYRASLLIANVAGERHPQVHWRYFSLTQVNSKMDNWTVWDAPADEKVRGRLAFRAAEAARRQDRFDSFHGALLGARHESRLDIDDIKVVEQVADESGLDLETFRRDIDDPAILEALARDHTHAVTQLGVFGTPTFVFPNGASAYIRLSAQAHNGGYALGLFDSLVRMAADEPGVLEMKRPVRPSAD